MKINSKHVHNGGRCSLASALSAIIQLFYKLFFSISKSKEL